MKTNETAVRVALGSVCATTKDICQSLAEQGVSTLVVQKEATQSSRDESAAGVAHQWSGKPGEDLFFNGWKLLF